MLPTAAIAMTVLTGGYGCDAWASFQTWFFPGHGLVVMPRSVHAPRPLATRVRDRGDVVELTFVFPKAWAVPRDGSEPRLLIELKPVEGTAFVPCPDSAPKEPPKDAKGGAKAMERLVTGY